MKTENMELIKNCEHKENLIKPEDCEINLQISEVVLTPFTCAALINEILKGLLYQKCQIPYPYSWLKTVMNKKLNQTENKEDTKQTNFTLVNHFRIVSSAYDTFEGVMKGLTREFKDSNGSIKEVVIAVGPSPQCPKEVFSIRIPNFSRSHIERNHINQIGKQQQKILRSLFLSQRWLDAIDASLTCTNTFIFLKKDLLKSGTKASDSCFVPCKPVEFSPNLKHIKINLNYEDGGNFNCCGDLSVFTDGEVQSSSSRDQRVYCDKKIETIAWFQSKHLVKGFKDCFVNKVSALELC